MTVPRSHGFQERRQSSRAHSRGTVQRNHLRVIASMDPGLIQRLAYCEKPDDQNHHVHAIEQLRDAEREPRVSRELVDADQSERETQTTG